MNKVSFLLVVVLVIAMAQTVVALQGTDSRMACHDVMDMVTCTLFRSKCDSSNKKEKEYMMASCAKSCQYCY